MTIRLFTLTLFFNASIFCAFGQEICDNGIDDDGDFLIDCADPDCNGSSLCLDNDSDGITDVIDLDDDNDGLLDSEEQNCSSGFISLNTIINETAVSGLVSGLWSYSTANVSLDYALVGSNPGTIPNWGSGITNQNNASIQPDGEYINLRPQNTDFGSGNYGRYSFSFNQRIVNLSAKVGGLDFDDELRIYAYLGGTSVKRVISDVNLGADLTLTTDGVVSSASAANAPSNSILIEVNEPLDSLVILSAKAAGSIHTANFNTTQVYEMTYCIAKDTDSDGIADFSDIDADGDGCFDVHEAGFTDDNNDGQLGDTPISVDANGQVISGSDGYSGINALVLNSALQSGCLDTDSDGISDLNDLDDDNDGISDADECYISSIIPKAPDGVQEEEYPYEYWDAEYYEGCYGIPGSTHSSDRTGTGGIGTPIYLGEAFFAQNQITLSDTRSFPTGTSHASPSTVPSNYVGTFWNPTGSFYGQIHFNRKASSDGTLDLGGSGSIDDVAEVYINGVQVMAASWCCGIGGALPITTYSLPFNQGDNIQFRYTNLGGPGSYDFSMTLNYTCSGDQDTDSDGLPDGIDWDSDGDGCSDILEAGFTDNDGDLQIDGTGINGDGTVTGSDGYGNPTETNSGTLDYLDEGLQSGCLDNDNDQIADFNDGDDDNDGIRDREEYDCAGTWNGLLVWDSNSAPNDAATINEPTYIASAQDITFGSGIGGVINSTRLELSGVDQSSLIAAIDQNDYIEYAITTNTGINSLYLSGIGSTKHPDFSGALPENYGYDISILISEDNFSTANVLKRQYYIDDVIPTGSFGSITFSPDDDYFFLDENTNYSLRVYFYNKEVNATAWYDDFWIFASFCTNDLDFDADTQPNHLDSDSDGDNCFDIVEAGFTDFNNDGVLGDSPETVNSYGVINSGIDGYTSPNSDFLNATNTACFEICGNGNDDNGDGRIDESYIAGVEDNLLLWLRADQGFGVSSWDDQSKNGNDASFIGNPSIVSNGQNFNALVDFDGDDAVYVDLPELVFDGTNNHVTLFLVYKPDNTSTSQGMFGNQHSSGFNNIYLNNGQIGTGGTNAPIVNSTYFSEEYHMISMVLDEENLVDGTNSEVFEKGQSTNVFAFDEVNASFISSDFYIGSSGLNATSNFFDGKIAEILIFFSNDGSLSLSASQIQKIESNLALKYGLSLENNYLGSQ